MKTFSVPNKSNARFLGIAFMLLAAFMIWLGLHGYLNTRIPSSYVKTTGTVINNQSYIGGGRYGTRTMYYPVIDFSAGSQNYTENGNISTATQPQYKPGDKVKIAYDPADPGLVKMLDTQGQGWASIVIVVMGVLALGPSVLGLRAGFRKNPKES